jgi:hypothetical protein
MISRSIYNLKIDTICTCYIPFDRSILQIWNGIRHVMPSTDRMLELTAKHRWLGRLTAGCVFQWVNKSLAASSWLYLHLRPKSLKSRKNIWFAAETKWHKSCVIRLMCCVGLLGLWLMIRHYIFRPLKSPRNSFVAWNRKPAAFRVGCNTAITVRQLLHPVCTAGSINILCRRFLPRSKVLLGKQKILQLVLWLQDTLHSLLIRKYFHVHCKCRITGRKARNLVLICGLRAFNLGWTQIGVDMADCLVPRCRHIAAGAG